MKKFSVFIFIIIVNGNMHAQSFFREIYESMPKNDRFSNMMNLRLYQEIYQDRAVAYFLLADICDQYMRETDPLVMFDILESYHNEFITYMGLTKLKLDNKQANQDREYFGKIEIISDKRKPGFEDILNEIDRKVESSQRYFRDAKEVHQNYVRCIDKYNECLYSFRRITRDFIDLKTLFLLSTPQIRSQIEQLAANFKSALQYFDAYKVACKKLPHLLKVNDYQLNEITTYRLEGLTEPDFTSETVQLWNYGSWAGQFIERLNSDIALIRTGIEKQDVQLARQAEELKQTSIYSDDHKLVWDDKLFYLTGKYDNASLANELLSYKRSKVQYLLKTKSKTNDPLDSADFDLFNKLVFFKDLAETMTALNFQADMLKKNIFIENTAKYKDFLISHYDGMDGLSRWCTLEKKDNELIFNDNLSNLDVFFKKSGQKYDFKDSTLVYNKKRIAFGVQKAGQMMKDTFITSGIIPFRKKWYFLHGLEFGKEGNSHSFLSKINPSGKLDWMVTPDLKLMKKSEPYISSVHISDDSICRVLCHTELFLKDSSRQILTYKSEINWKGKTEKQCIIDSTLYPAYFWVDEINEQYLTITMGNGSKTGQPAMEDMKVKLYNFNDSLVWQRCYKISGQLVDVIHSNSNFYILFNMKGSGFTDTTGKQFFTTGYPGIAGIYIQRDGTVKHINYYNTKTKLTAVFCKKIHDNSINIFGKIQESENLATPYFYIVTDNQGVPVFSNVKELSFQSVTVD